MAVTCFVELVFVEALGEEEELLAIDRIRTVPVHCSPKSQEGSTIEPILSTIPI